MVDYWIHALDDTNTPFPTIAPASPTSAPSGVVQYMTTNNKDSIQTTDVNEDGPITHKDGPEGNDESKLIVIICVVVGLLIIIPISGFFIYKCYKKNKAPNMDGVSLPSRSELQLNDIGGNIDETTALTPESTHL